MAAREIPDLRQSLAARGGHRGRGRGRGGPGGRHDLNDEEKDRIVQDTDCDASDSRLSAVKLGYLQDPFAHKLSRGRDTSRRYPIINRGMGACLRKPGRSQSLNYCRNIRSINSNRLARGKLPLDRPARAKADTVSWCGLRHAVFPNSFKGFQCASGLS